MWKHPVGNVLHIGLFLATGIVLMGLARPVVGHAALNNIAFIDLLRVSNEAVRGNPVLTPPLDQLPGSSQGALRSASALYRTVLMTATDDASAAYGLGYLSLATGDYPGAAAAFGVLTGQRADFAFSWETIALYRSGGLNGLSLGERKAVAERLADTAYRYLDTGRRSQALIVYEAATEIAPDEIPIWLDRIYSYANEWDKARLAYEHTIRLHPNDAYLTMVGAYLSLYGSGDYVQARVLAERSMQGLQDVDPVSLTRSYKTWLYNGYIVNADLALQEGDLRQAEVWLQKAIDLPGTLPDRSIALRRLSLLNSSTAP